MQQSSSRITQRLTQCCQFGIVAALMLLSYGCGSTDKEQGEQLIREIRESTILPQLGSYDEKEQKAAIRVVLRGMEKNPKGICEVLAAGLRDPVLDERTLLVIARLLSKERDERAIPVLLRHLGVSTESAKGFVRDALLEFGTQVIPSVAESLESGDNLTRLNAAELLLDIGHPECFESLWQRYSIEPEGEVRFLIICGVAREKRSRAISRLATALADADPSVREHSWHALSKRVQLPSILEFDPEADEQMRDQQQQLVRNWIASKDL